MQSEDLSKPKRESPSIVVVGGGVSGLTCAHELLLAGYNNVTILESQGALGGKIFADYDAEHNFYEHSTRVFMKSYISVFDIMKKVPYLEGTVFDNIVAMSAMVWMKMDGPGRAEWPSQATTRETFNATVQSMHEDGVPGDEISFYLTQLSKFVSASELERRQLTDGKTFAEFLDFPARTPTFRRTITHQIGVIVAARTTSSAYAIMSLLEALSVAPTKPEYSEMATFNQLNGPTQLRWTEPWADELERLGAHIELSCEITGVAVGETGNVVSVETSNGQRSGDIFVFAVPSSVLTKLMPDVVAPETFKREWSLGLQCQLTADYDFLTYGSRYVATIDSPWEIVSAVYRPTHDDVWRQLEHEKALLAEGTAGVLSSTMSNQFAPGALFGKPFVMCSYEEAVFEMLFQAGVPKGELPELSRTAKFGPGTEYVGFADLDRYPDYERGPVQPNGKLWITNSALYVKLPNDPVFSPKGDPKSPVPYNMFLAGEFVDTPFMQVPTMELACESGKLAGRSVIDSYGLPNSSYSMTGFDFDDLEITRPGRIEEMALATKMLKLRLQKS